MNIERLNTAFENSDFKTQKDLANECGWSPSKMTRIVNGDQELSAHDLMKLCKALKVSADYILGIDGVDAFAFTKEELFYLKTIVQYDISDPACDGSDDLRWSVYDKLVKG